MATYVLVPGGGHGGWCYQFVAQMLRNNGHFVTATPRQTALRLCNRFAGGLQRRDDFADRPPALSAVRTGTAGAGHLF